MHAVCHKNDANKNLMFAGYGPFSQIRSHMGNIDSVFTLPALAEESDPSQPFSGWILAKAVIPV